MKKITISILTTAAYLASAVPSMAATSIGTVCSKTSIGFGNLCLGASDIGKTLGNIVNLLFLVAGIIALFFLVIGGIKWVTSEGDSKNVEAARGQIIAAAMGLAITFLSYLIINLLLRFFLGQDLNQLQLPSING